MNTTPTARVGNLHLYKTAQGYVLTTLAGETVGTYPTAKAANEAGIARIAAAYKAR